MDMPMEKFHATKEDITADLHTVASALNMWLIKCSSLVVALSS